MSEERKKITDALREGRVEFTPKSQEAFESMALWKGGKPDFTITDAKVTFWGPWHRSKCQSLNCDFAIAEPWPEDVEPVCPDCGEAIQHFGNEGGMGIDWGTKSAGFGRMDFSIKDGELTVMSEAMGKGFAMSLFKYIVDNTEWDF